jgi:c-di-GMP phosphodiesterase
MTTVVEETSSVAVARQPIFDRAETITGFEILYRSLTGPFTDAEGATSTVIVQSLADIGLERLVGDARAFINVTADFLLKVRPLPMPPERVVLELVGSHSADPELLGALRDARDAGFRIALDGFRYAPGLEPPLALASVVNSTSARCPGTRCSSRSPSCGAAG